MNFNNNTFLGDVLTKYFLNQDLSREDILNKYYGDIPINLSMLLGKYRFDYSNQLSREQSTFLGAFIELFGENPDKEACLGVMSRLAGRPLNIFDAHLETYAIITDTNNTNRSLSQSPYGNISALLILHLLKTNFNYSATPDKDLYLFLFNGLRWTNESVEMDDIGSYADNLFIVIVPVYYYLACYYDFFNFYEQIIGEPIENLVGLSQTDIESKLDAHFNLLTDLKHPKATPLKALPTTEEASKNKQSEGCYIATCAYGDYDCHEVLTLRKFRDKCLAKSTLGRLFIKAYYAISPKIVDLLGENVLFKKLALSVLNPLVIVLSKRNY